MVVVLPAPLGPSRPKHSPRGDLQVEAADGLDRRLARVRLDQAGAADGGRAHPDIIGAGRLTGTVDATARWLLERFDVAADAQRLTRDHSTRGRAEKEHHFRDVVGR